MALTAGAPIRRVVTNIVGHVAQLVVTGTVLGLIVAIPAMRFIEKQLYGVSAHDPIVFIGAALALLAVGVSASSAPARRAARVDPQIVLREE